MRQIPDGALEKKTINLGDIPKTLSFIFQKDSKTFLACNSLTQISKQQQKMPNVILHLSIAYN